MYIVANSTDRNESHCGANRITNWQNETNYKFVINNQDFLILYLLIERQNYDQDSNESTDNGYYFSFS